MGAPASAVKGQRALGEGRFAGSDHAAAALRALLGEDARALRAATGARDVHTTIGPAACGIRGLGPACVRAAARTDTLFCEVTPPVELPEPVASFRSADRSPVVAAFLDTTRELCATVGKSLDLPPGAARL
ncbi:hypothetical protein [Streptomyces sp. 150FB]|uniref:hypothetical protein n=1 Tax=Streptomyces sp. 150FB TaxID=1576605 RepID=UPI00191BFB70|nr:hypothetical protein [Streptomyces sp. 150FB]